MFNDLGYNVDLLILGIAVASSVLLGSIVFYKDRKSATGIFFLLFTIVTSAWSILNYLAYQITDPFWSLWLVRVVMFLAVYQAFFFFILVKTIPQRKVGLTGKWRRFLFPWVVVVSILTLTPLVFSGVQIEQGKAPSPEPAPGIVLFASTAVSLVVTGIVTLVRRVRSPDQEIRRQFRILFVGVVLMFLFIIVFNFLFVTVLGNSDFIPLSALFTLPFVIMTFYAIARYGLMNIKIIGTEILVFFLLVVTFLDVVFSTDQGQLVFRVIVFGIALLFSIFLVRSVINEVRQRERLEELTQKLKEMDDQKDEFISMAAHELRAPMTAIKGFLSMVLEGDTGQISDKTREFLGDANTINERLIRLVRNMLDVTRIEEGRLVYQLEDCRLSEVTRLVYNQFILEAKRKGLEYELVIPREIKDTVHADVDKLNEVMGNLISNAIKYTDQGKIMIRLLQPKSRIVRFEVEDTGAGISEAEKEKLFRKFYRIESGVGKTTGTGLGLYISKLLIEKFGGRIGVESKPGKGSIFWFELSVVNGPVSA